MGGDPQDRRDERILILAPTGRDAALTARFLRDAGLSAQACEDAGHLCREMEEGAGLLFLTEEALPPAAARRLTEALARQPAWSDIPVLVLTSSGAGTPAGAAALSALGEAGNVTLVERPVRVTTLTSAVRSALRARRHQYEVREHLAAERRAKEERQQSAEMLEELLTREQSARSEAERQRDFTRRVLEDAPIAVGVMEGPDHVFTLVNRYTCELAGLAEEQFLGRPHQVVVPEADKVVGPILDRVYATGLSETAEVEVELPSGRRQLLVTWTALPARRGRKGAVLYLALDITARKRAEEALRESERQLRTLADAVPQLVWMAEPDGHIFWYNHRWYEYTGTTPAEMEGWGWQSVHDPEMLPKVVERWRRSLETGEPFEMEFPLKGADGRFRWFLTRVNPLRDSEGRILRWFGTNTDVDEQRRTAEELREANRLKDEFLATVSHELRTPLTAILGWARMLQSGQLDGGGTERAIETIERNAWAQSQLIEDILDVSRVITGKLRLEVQPVDLAQVIESSINAVLPASEAKGIRLQRVLDSGASTVSGDPARLQQVIWNLLSNAIKFTPKGGRVQVRLERVNSHVELSVTDTGQGIAPEALPHIFERFRQEDSSTTRAHAGLGLGLAIVRHLVEMHGGTVEAESAGPGRGATFTVRLPLVAVRAPTAGRAAAERVHPTADSGAPFDCPPELEGLRLLIVDDEEDTRLLLKAVLEQYGATVTTVSTVAEALAALKETRPDVIISDLGMPGEDGYSLIRKVRALPAAEGGQTPCAALTAYARVEDRMKVLRSGFQIHVPKPVEPAELVAVVANLAGRIATGGT